jgi:hypothetical protein
LRGSGSCPQWAKLRGAPSLINARDDKLAPSGQPRD